MFKKIGAILIVFVLTLFVSGCGSKSNNSLLADTTWKEDYGSELVLTKNKLTWYETEGEHDDNYQSGTYKFFRGEEAVNYVTTELSSFGVTRDELEGIFDRSDKYSKKDFIVLDIYYDAFKMDGEMQEIKDSHIPWFGFILQNDTYLDVANMKTGTYYGFKKN